MTRALLLALALPAAAFAHHGWSTYDAEKPVTVTGTLSNVEWGGPHATARLVRDKKQWNVVMAPVTRMDARGLTPAMLSAGKPVTLYGQIRKDGTAEMKVEKLTLEGKSYDLMR